VHLVGVSRERIRHPHSSRSLLAQGHGADAHAIRRFVVHGHFHHLGAEGCRRQTVGAGHQRPRPDHHVPLPGHAGPDAGPVVGREVLDDLPGKLGFLAHEYPLVGHEAVLEEKKRLGDPRLRNVEPVFHFPRVAGPARLHDSQPFDVPGHHHHHRVVLVLIPVPAAGQNENLVGCRHAANHRLGAADHDPVLAHFLDVHVAVRVGLLRGPKRAVPLGVRQCPRHYQPLLLGAQDPLLEPLLVVRAAFLVDERRHVPHHVLGVPPHAQAPVARAREPVHPALELGIGHDVLKGLHHGVPPVDLLPREARHRREILRVLGVMRGVESPGVAFHCPARGRMRGHVLDQLPELVNVGAHPLQ